MRTVDRRELLKSMAGGTTGLTALLAGCTGQQPWKTCLWVESVTPERAANDVTTPLEEIPAVHSEALHLTPWERRNSLGQRVPDVRGESQEIAGKAVQNSEAHTSGIEVLWRPAYVEIEGSFSPRPPTFVEIDGVYHQIDHSEEPGVTTDINRWLLGSEVIDSSSLDAEPAHIDDIGSPKQRYIRKAIRGARLIHRAHESEEEVEAYFDHVDFGRPPTLATAGNQFHPSHPFFVHVFRESDADPSRLDLVPDPNPTVIEHSDGTVLRLWAEKRTVVEPKITYTSERIGDKPGGFMDYYAGEESLTQREREIFEQAMDGGFESEEYEDLDSRGEAIDSLLDKFERHRYDTVTGYWWVDGELYYVAAEEDRVPLECEDHVTGWGGPA